MDCGLNGMKVDKSNLKKNIKMGKMMDYGLSGMKVDKSNLKKNIKMG